MKSLILASVLATTAFAVSAETYGESIKGHQVSASQSRASVQQEARLALSHGLIAAGEHSQEGPFVLQPSQARTRSEVRAEVAQLRAAGKLHVHGQGRGRL